MFAPPHYICGDLVALLSRPPSENTAFLRPYNRGTEESLDDLNRLAQTGIVSKAAKSLAILCWSQLSIARCCRAEIAK